MLFPRRAGWLIADGVLLAFALLAPRAAPARAISLSARTDRLIDRLEQLGVVIDRLERCGPGVERAAHNMGVTIEGWDIEESKAGFREEKAAIWGLKPEQLTQA